ncbi:MAG: hypothetical protein QXZ68_04730 [Candidatus Bathyarchaeia archaeon]
MHCGLLFNKFGLTAIDSLMEYFANNNDWKSVCKLKRYAEINLYSSTTIDGAVKSAIDNINKVDGLPITEDSLFNVSQRPLINLPIWAIKLEYGREKWTGSDMFNSLSQCLNVENKPFRSCNPSTREVFHGTYGVEWYIEAAQTLDCFLNLHSQGVEGAIDKALQIWNWLNDQLYTGTYYKYAENYGGFEGNLNFPIIIAKLNAKHKLENFNNVINDIDTRLLANGWESPQWINYAIAGHNTLDQTPRLRQTACAFIALHTLYPLFPQPMKTRLASIISGTPKAWVGLTESSGLFDADTKRFKMCPEDTPSDVASSIGCITLFLQGILPDTGSLAIPLLEEFEADTISMMPCSMFRFNVETRQVTIPVFAGSLAFQYGTDIISHDFEYDGIWRLTFSDDWNHIIKVEYVSNLPTQYAFVKTPSAPPTSQIAQIFQTLVAIMMVFVLFSILSLLTERDWLGGGRNEYKQKPPYSVRY